jgi:D-serine deaminase-like pyridoxal phosphate-dependent protein
VTGAGWRQPWEDARSTVLRQYNVHTGRPVDDLVTPALVVDLDAVDRNIATMTAALAGGAVRLRPHTKVQKSPDLAKRQLAAGAVGVTVATVWEAAAMAAAGVDDILIANEVVGAAKIATLAALARHARITVAVDAADNIRDLSVAATAAGTEVSALVDLDVGMGRCGARSLEEAVALAGLVDGASGLVLAGVQAYEGHCMLEPDRDLRLRLATAAMDYAAEVAGSVRRRFPAATTLSSGGTGTYRITGRHPAVTELQAGSYVFMDAFHGNLVDGFDVSLSVLSTVMARHGDTVILDAGRKSIGIDFVLPPIFGHKYEARYYAEEHALFDVDAGLSARAGDRLRLIAGYAPSTVNLHDVIFAARGGVVQEVWPVFPRGPGHHGFLTALSDP